MADLVLFGAHQVEAILTYESGWLIDNDDGLERMAGWVSVG